MLRCFGAASEKTHQGKTPSTMSTAGTGSTNTTVTGSLMIHLQPFGQQGIPNLLLSYWRHQSLVVFTHQPEAPRVPRGNL